jgi:hypothetical protein
MPDYADTPVGATIPPDAAFVLGDAQVAPKPALKTPGQRRFTLI